MRCEGFLMLSNFFDLLTLRKTVDWRIFRIDPKMISEAAGSL